MAQTRFQASDADEGISVTDDGLRASSSVDAWRGVRLNLKVPAGASGTYAVVVNSGLVRVGWGVAEGPRVMGNDCSSFGYGGTGKFVHKKKFENYGEPMQPGDRITCSVDRSAASLVLHFERNGRNLGQALNLAPAQVPEDLRDAQLVGLWLVVSSMCPSSPLPRVLLHLRLLKSAGS